MKSYLKIIFVFSLLIFIVIGSMIFLNNRNNAQLFDIPEYYKNLAHECEKIENYDCCIDSLRIMTENQYFLALESGCPEGFKENMLRCPGSFKWCEPSDCSFTNSDACDKSCNENEDCKPSFGFCVNINENVFLPLGMNPAYQEVYCECQENICIGVPTGVAVI